jgi:hypothetical protein
VGCTLFPKRARRVRLQRILSKEENHERFRCEGRPRRGHCFHH